MPAKKNTKNTKKKTRTYKKKATPVKVLLPAIIPGQDVHDPPSEYELSYEDAMLSVKMEKLAAKGLTNDQIIAALPLSRYTFYQRLKENPYFSYCLMKHRGKAVESVENALYNNAVGFHYEEEQATASGKVVNVQKMKLPETKAQEFYLTNRVPDQWKKKVETTHALGEGMGAITFSIKRYEE